MRYIKCCVRVWLLLFFFLALFVGTIYANRQQSGVFPSYFTLSNTALENSKGLSWLIDQDFKDYALWRFENLNYPLGQEFLIVKYLFFVKNNDNIPSFKAGVKITYTNPSTGEKIINIVSRKLDEFNKFVIEDKLPTSFINEKGSLIITIERLKDVFYMLGVKKNTVVILNTKPTKERDLIADNEGVFLPTAYLRRPVGVTGSVRSKLSLDVMSLFFPRYEFKSEEEESAGFFGVDISYKLKDEEGLLPAVGIGLTGLYPIISRALYNERLYNSFYVVGSKRFRSVFNFSLGSMIGNTIEVFMFPDNNKLEREDNRFVVFGGCIFQAAKNTALKIETARDLDRGEWISLWAFSLQLLENRVLFDVGVVDSSLNNRRENELFILSKIKL